jgi:two-component system invasion response regulator UvrY
MKRILIADDHFIVRTGLTTLLKQKFLNVEIEETSGGESTWKKLEANEYDLAILDIGMPGTDTIHLIKNVLAIHPQQKILILTMASEEIYGRKYLQLGVRGFISKEASPDELSKAIVTILNDRRYVSAQLQEQLNNDIIGHKVSNPFETLSSRELQVMMYLVEGKNVSQIASTLSVHTSTIGTHKSRIMQKLGVDNLIDLNKIASMFTGASE